MIKYNTKEVYELEIKTAKDLNITVKNIKHFSGHDGMTGINADIYYNNKKFANAYDDARGGCMDIRPCSYSDINVMAMFKEVEDKLKALPEHTLVYNKTYNGKPIQFTTKVKLDAIVDAIAQQKESLKEDRKGIRYTTPDGDYVSHWNMSIPAMLKKYPKNALSTIQKKCDKLSAKYPILNRDYLASIGIRVNDSV